MCGIAGEIRFDGRSVQVSELEKMSNVLAPRGPDGQGVYTENQCGFTHRRLKIMDLSEASHQPMVDAALGLSIVFNGAIYNYKELKKELIEKGYRFFSTGDTEVLLKAYHYWGKDFVKKLNGMFAFCIWERESKKTFFARDRLGIKPLYFSSVKNSSDGHFLRFASSLPALLATKGIDKSLQKEALHFYMNFHSIVPPPLTLIKGIQKLPPATLMEVFPDGKIIQSTYWDLSFQSDRYKNLDEIELGDLLLEKLRLAVKRRCVADVPVGVLLSGGLDSSLIAGLLAEAGQKNLNTFSVGFHSVGDEKGDEFEYSDIIAHHFQTKHHKIKVSPELTLSSLDKTFHSMSEPMVSHDNVGFFLLSQEVSKHIKVVQSGQGADEVFGGYHWYQRIENEFKSNPMSDTYEKIFFDRSEVEMKEALSPEFYSEKATQKWIKNYFNQNNIPSNPVEASLKIDTQVMLVDDPVKRVDNMTMAFGLEARVPFLDHELVEFAACIPADLKIKNGGKYLLKEVSRKVIPKEVIDRPKGYFPVPALKYIQGDFLNFVKETLLSQSAQTRGIFQKPYIEKLLKNPKEHITPLRGSKLWQLTVLQAWMERHHV